jgi:glycogen synthase
MVGRRDGDKVNLLLFVNSVFIGGMEEHVRLIARDLDRDRFVVHTVVPQWEQTEPFTQSMRLVSDHLVQLTPDRRHGVTRQLRDAVRLFRQVRRWRIDAAHLHSTTYGGQALAFIVLRLARVRPILVTEHLAPETRPPLRSRLIRNVLSRSFDGIVSVSQKNQQARRAFLHTPSDKSFVVDNGVDLDRFAPPSAEVAAPAAVAALPDDAQIIGTAVRFEPEKGLDTLLQAFDVLAQTRPQAHLLMVGDGSLRTELEQQAARLASGSRVHFVGFQSDPRPYLMHMDVFALPVPFGSMSIGLLEAMALERACVITFGGDGEAIVDGESGLFARPNDHEHLAATIARLLDDHAYRARIAAGARTRIESHFASTRVAAELGALYLSLSERR